MINILMASGFLARGGTEAFMMNVFRHIDYNKFHIDFIISSRKDIAYEEEIIKSGSKVFIIPPRKNGIEHYRALNSFFKTNRGKYQVLHWCTGSCTSISELYYAYKYDVPIRIIHSHSSDCVGLHNKILHRLFRPVANIMATHRLACSDKASVWMFEKRDSMILKNGIDLTGYSYNTTIRNEYRKLFGIKADTIVIGHVGRFDPVKNHEKIIGIFSEYLNLNDNAVLMLIGKGRETEHIKDIVNSLGIMKKVLFLGERKDVPQLMQAMDIFLMPSLFEGLPFVLVEAQAAGLPCLVADTVDRHSKITGLLNFASLNDGNETWAGDLFGLKDYVRHSEQKDIVDAGYSIEDTVNRLESIYKGK